MCEPCSNGWGCRGPGGTSCSEASRAPTHQHTKAEKELSELRAEQEVTTRDFKQLEEDAFSVMQAFEAAKASAEAKQKELSAKEEEFDALFDKIVEGLPNGEPAERHAVGAI